MKTIRTQHIITALFACVLALITTSTQAQAVSSGEARIIAQEAYIYFYPLVIMDVSRKHFTNIEAGKMFARGPMNTFSHARTFPPATFRGATHANFDTLYSMGWLDLTNEPVVISVPDTRGRYYLLQLLDMWTDSFAGVGKRTTGTGTGDFAVIGPGWQGELPESLQRINAPTPFVWVIGRTRTDGPQDYDAVHKVQDGYKITRSHSGGNHRRLSRRCRRIALQEGQNQALTAALKQQAEQIQKVSAQIELGKAAPQTVLNNR